MEAPDVDGWKVRNLVGSGICGQVFLVEDESGRLMTVKIFEESAINRKLLAETTERLETGGWPSGVMPVLSADFAGFPPIKVNDWFGKVGGEHPVPASLHQRWSAYSGACAVPVILGVARALAGMHRRGVPHGNLKPGNVFFNKAGEVLLTDWSLGNIPDASPRGFSDALLYQAPEQLRNPDGYRFGVGFGWDVFAFGVLAFRLLTGVFPRCDETFQTVVPEEGQPAREGIHAENRRIAARLEGQAAVVWPSEAEFPGQEAVREWIIRCLELDRQLRPQSMVEVWRGLEVASAGTNRDADREILLDQRRASDHRASRAYFVAAGTLVVAVALGALWLLAEMHNRSAQSNFLDEISGMQTQLATARAARTAGVTAVATARQQLTDERDRALAQLSASRLVADRVFSWAMEKGHRRLPPLDGRELRLRNLERYLEEFAAQAREVPALEEERARTLLQLAEISLATGDVNQAAARLNEAVNAWLRKEMPPDLQLRVATARLLLALLMQTSGDASTQEAFVVARGALMHLPQTEIDADRLSQLLAILDFHEAKLLAAHGEDAEALAQLMRATQTLNRLASERPDSVVLRSELAACYLSSATILEGIGEFGDARGARALAATELTKLIEENPDDVGLRLELAGSYGAMAESAVLSGDLAGADGFAQESMALLAGVIREQPENVEAVAHMAAQLGLRADIMRDTGKTEEALRTFDEGIRMIESVRASDPKNPTTAYRLALLGWQKGKMLGTGGDRNEEIAFLNRSRALLLELETDGHPAGPPRDQVQRSLAYLLGDLGHACQLAKQMEDAKSAFGEAVKRWEALSNSRPESEEFEEGLAWSRQRLNELP
jgi:serine/threonine protein kinase